MFHHRVVVFELVDVFESEHKVLRRLHFPSALFLFLFLRFRDSLGSVTVECSVVWLFFCLKVTLVVVTVAAVCFCLSFWQLRKSTMLSLPLWKHTMHRLANDESLPLCCWYCKQSVTILCVWCCVDVAIPPFCCPDDTATFQLHAGTVVLCSVCVCALPVFG